MKPSYGQFSLLIVLCPLLIAAAGKADAGPVIEPVHSDASTAEPAIHSYTLSEALAYARDHQPALRAAQAEAHLRSEGTKVPRHQWLPFLGVNAQGFVGSVNNSSTISAISPVVLLPRIGGVPLGSNSMKGYGSTLAAVGLSQEVFDFGRIAAEAAEADAQLDVARLDLESSLLDLQFNVEESFYAVYAAKGIAVASQQAYERALIHRDMAQASVNVGLRSPVDLARTEALLGQIDVGRIRAQGNVQAAQSVLATAMGSSEALVDVADVNLVPAPMPTLDAMMTRLEQRNPQILVADARLKAQEKTTHAVAAQMLPNLNLTATLSGRAGGAGAVHPDGDGFIPSIVNWHVGLLLNWSAFDAVVLAREDVSLAAELERREQLALAYQTERAALQQAYIAASVALAAVPALRQSKDAARVNYDQTNARFESGLGTSLELADAENIRIDAEIKYSIGEFEAARTRAALNRLIAEGLNKN